MRYVGNVYRPPSERNSLIVQVTYGCSHNTCAFCAMYRGERFALRPLGEVLEDFELARACSPAVERIFLADGDALIRRTGELTTILTAAREKFPECRRISCYASPASLLLKSEEELRTLAAAGLGMVYMGLESGSDEVLRRMDKGYAAAEIVSAGQKARRCGLALSVTAISGLGGQEFSADHAAGTARALNAMNPEYIGVLTLLVEEGTPLERWVREGSFRLLDSRAVLEETLALVSALDSPGSVFRMNHPSNYLSLRGTLNRDRETMLAAVRDAMAHTERLRPEGWRAL